MSQPARDSGFTLLEVLVAVALLGVMMAIAVSGWSSWARSSQHTGTAQAIQSVMRQTQQRAVTEGRSMCVLFDPAVDSFEVFRGRCDDPGKVKVLGPMGTDSAAVNIEAPSFTSSVSTGNPGVTFRARGTAWPGQVRVTRDGSSKVYTIKVEGLTGRASLS